MKRWLLAALLIFTLASPVEARDFSADIPLMIKRIAALSGLPVAASLRVVKHAPVSVIIRMTGKSYARATYHPGSHAIFYAPGHSDLIPHEIVHVLQIAAGLIPTTPNSERHAARIGREYRKQWPN